MDDKKQKGVFDKILISIFELIRFTGIWLILIFYFLWKSLDHFFPSFHGFYISQEGSFIHNFLFVILSVISALILLSNIIRLFKKNFSWRRVFYYFKHKRKFKGWTKEEIENHNRRVNEIVDEMFSKSTPYDPK